MGQGLTLSLFVVYLHNVRGFSTDFATLLLSAAALVGIASSPIWGTLTDRLGPIRVIMIAVVADAASLIFWAHAHSETQAAIAALLLALFGGAGWGPSSTLLSRMVAPEHRQRAFGFNFMLVNLGIGFGGLVSASIVNLHDPNSFVMLYTFNAGVTFVGRTHRPHPAQIRWADQRASRRSRRTGAEGWRVVLRDRRLRRYVLAAIVLMIGGYGSQEAGFSLFVVNNLKLPVHVIGIIFFFNTTTIVCSQLWVLNRIEGKSRTKVMATVAVFWLVFWVILDVALGAANGPRGHLAVLRDDRLRPRRDDALPGRPGARQRDRARAPSWSLQRRGRTRLGRLGDARARHHRALLQRSPRRLVAARHRRHRARGRSSSCCRFVDT